MLLSGLTSLRLLSGCGLSPSQPQKPHSGTPPLVEATSLALIKFGHIEHQFQTPGALGTSLLESKHPLPCCYKDCCGLAGHRSSPQSPKAGKPCSFTAIDHIFSHRRVYINLQKGTPLAESSFALEDAASWLEIAVPLTEVPSLPAQRLELQVNSPKF